MLVVLSMIIYENNEFFVTSEVSPKKDEYVSSDIINLHNE